jgi:hypothetical protein
MCVWTRNSSCFSVLFSVQVVGLPGSGKPCTLWLVALSRLGARVSLACQSAAEWCSFASLTARWLRAAGATLRTATSNPILTCLWVIPCCVIVDPLVPSQDHTGVTSCRPIQRSPSGQSRPHQQWLLRPRTKCLVLNATPQHSSKSSLSRPSSWP